MPEHGVRRAYSQCPFRIDTYYEESHLGHGTGFFVEYGGDWFVITNGHVVTGRHFLTRGILSDDDPTVTSCPTMLKIRVAGYDESVPGGWYQMQYLSIDLFDDGDPVWYVHPELEHKCDVVAIAIDWPKRQSRLWHRAINRISDDRIPVEPGVTVFILGYPLGIEVKLGLPIWKSGYIASEPYFPVSLKEDPEEPVQKGPLDGLPAFFLDSQTRRGMSGSPVIAQYSGTWDLTDPYTPPTVENLQPINWDHLVLGGTASEFIGCYSARIESTELEAGLGLCWRKEVIEEICTAQHRAPNPHIR